MTRPLSLEYVMRLGFIAGCLIAGPVGFTVGVLVCAWCGN